MNETCRCGSGELPYWKYDGRGIPLCKVCSQCEEEKVARYRPEILSYYTEADVDEQIEPDE